MPSLEDIQREQLMELVDALRPFAKGPLSSPAVTNARYLIEKWDRLERADIEMQARQGVADATRKWFSDRSPLL